MALTPLVGGKSQSALLHTLATSGQLPMGAESFPVGREGELCSPCLLRVKDNPGRNLGPQLLSATWLRYHTTAVFLPVPDGQATFPSPKEATHLTPPLTAAPQMTPLGPGFHSCQFQSLSKEGKARSSRESLWHRGATEACWVILFSQGCCENKAEGRRRL